MHIKLSRKARKRGAALVAALAGIGLVLGGCAVKAIISKAHKIEEKRRRQATNDIVEVPQLFTQHFPVLPMNAVSPIITEPSPSPTPPNFQAHVNTNYYNAALEDESGF